MLHAHDNRQVSTDLNKNSFFLPQWVSIPGAVIYKLISDDL